MKRIVGATLAPLLAAACSSSPAVETSAESQHAIVNGQLDTTHQAVVAVALVSGNSGGLCSGTIVKVDAAKKIGYVLTAAHCMDDAKPEYIVQGEDMMSYSSLRYTVLDWAVHPGWDGRTGNDYDFAVVRFLGADATTPFMSMATAAEDTVKSGSTVTSVGYGTTDPNGDDQVSPNTKRRKYTARLNSYTDSTWIAYSLASGGICFGDSGGPELAQIGGKEKVVGVHSFVSGGGGGSCTGEGFSGRVSAVSSFINPELAKTTYQASCATCKGLRESGKNVCGATMAKCYDDPACKALVDCMTACGDFVCQTKCKSTNKDGLGHLNAYLLCPCVGDCKSTCASDQQCSGYGTCGFNFPKGDCRTCYESQCCTESTACSVDGDCHRCWLNPSYAGCATNKLYQALTTCQTNKCASACNPQVPDAGPPDTGPTQPDTGPVAPDAGPSQETSVPPDPDSGEPVEPVDPEEPPPDEEVPEEPQPAAPTSAGSSGGCQTSASGVTPGHGLWAAALAMGLAASMRRRRNR